MSDYISLSELTGDLHIIACWELVGATAVLRDSDDNVFYKGFNRHVKSSSVAFYKMKPGNYTVSIIVKGEEQEPPVGKQYVTIFPVQVVELDWCGDC